MLFKNEISLVWNVLTCVLGTFFCVILSRIWPTFSKITKICPYIFCLPKIRKTLRKHLVWGNFRGILQKVEVISSVIWVVRANGIKRNIVLAIWGRMFHKWVIITMIHILLKRGGNDNDRFPKISRPAQL